MTHEAPVMTWNFFLTLILIPALGWYLSNVIKSRERMARDAFELWKAGAFERHAELERRIAKLEACFLELKKMISERVTAAHCESQGREVRAVLANINQNLVTMTDRSWRQDRWTDKMTGGGQ